MIFCLCNLGFCSHRNSKEHPFFRRAALNPWCLIIDTIPFILLIRAVSNKLTLSESSASQMEL